MKIIRFKHKKNYIKKTVRNYGKKYKYENKLIQKLILIIIFLTLFLLDFIIDPFRKKQKILNVLNGANEKIDISTLSEDDHYKILLPKMKYHPIKRVKPGEKITLFKLEDSYDYKKMKETGKDKYIYNICTITKAKYENLYVKEFVDYYLSIGVEKFYFGDDNEENMENLSDVLGDYIKKGIVDIDYIYYKNMSHEMFFDESFKVLKFRCNWFLFIDVDEFLEFNDKNMNIKTYLDMPIFDKCDAIRIHWIAYDDNNLVKYDSRPIRERLNHSVSESHFSRFHKSIVRGKDYKGTVFTGTMHQPVFETVPEQCDAEGNFEKFGIGILGYPRYKYCFFRHYTFKTSEEFTMKILKGLHQNHKYDIDGMVDEFFKLNKYTDEKLKVLEHIFNKTFPKYHNNIN